ncbi:MAG: efflux RND transporter periplasmic adaptor subunit [Thermoanaerobaculia bacterium]
MKGSRLAALVLILVLAGCRGSQESPPNRGDVRFPVETVTVANRPVEYSLSAVGSIEAFEKVAVTARVGGVVEKVRFREGDRVGTETSLAEIEPARYRLAEDAARSALAKAEATAAEAANGLERRQAVNARNPDLVRAEEVDSWRTRVAAARADVEQARTALRLAELNVRDAYVRPPIAGVIQTREIETGQYVQPGAMIATIVRRDPLLLRFRVPESEADSIHTGMRARFQLRGSRDREYQADIRLVGAAASEADRMVTVTAEVDDPNRDDLRPGAFVQVTVPIGEASAPVIPQTAIRPSERGFLAYVIQGDLAEERVLELGLRTAEGQVEVRSGLAAGEQLVVRGAEALRNGARVAVAPAPEG